jgi:hypothetical protein
MKYTNSTTANTYISNGDIGDVVYPRVSSPKLLNAFQWRLHASSNTVDESGLGLYQPNITLTVHGAQGIEQVAVADYIALLLCIREAPSSRLGQEARHVEAFRG